MGLFVVFEGVDGSGKSTQSRALKNRLTRASYSSILVHEPGGTPTAERIRRWLKSNHPTSPLAELLLLTAARASLVESVILPTLTEGTIVVCDRFIYSTVAYQAYGRGLSLNMVRELNEIATNGILPHLVVLMDLPPDAGLARKSTKAMDRFEREHLDFHQRVRKAYLTLAEQDPTRWLILDSTLPKASLSNLIWTRVSEMLLKINSADVRLDRGSGTG